MSALLAAALEYAAARLPVFPCVAKSPAVARGFYSATLNPATIERLWRQADRNIGIPTGPLSGFWVLDIDGDTGETSLRALEAKHGPLPATRTVITGGGGRHFWFRYTGAIPSTTGRIGPSLDTRGDGGYVIVPPSITGRRYEFISYDQLADAPAWLVQLARTKPRSISERALSAIRRPTTNGQPSAYGLAALEREIEALAATPAGGRNHALNRCAFRLFQLVAGGELYGDQVSERLIEASHRNGLVKDDGLRSVLATIRSGARAGLTHPRSRVGGA